MYWSSSFDRDPLRSCFFQCVHTCRLCPISHKGDSSGCTFPSRSVASSYGDSSWFLSSFCFFFSFFNCLFHLSSLILLLFSFLLNLLFFVSIFEYIFQLKLFALLKLFDQFFQHNFVYLAWSFFIKADLTVRDFNFHYSISFLKSQFYNHNFFEFFQDFLNFN